jgi:hypothetical protein
MSDFFGNSGGFNKLQGIGLMLSALNPQSFNSTLGMLEMQQASNRMRREQDQEQAAQTLLSPIGQTLQRGASMDIPARPGAYRPNMTMGANGPMFNPTQEAGLPARPAMDDDMVRNLTIRAMGGPAKYFAMQQAQQAAANQPFNLSPGEVRYQGGRPVASAPFKPEAPPEILNPEVQAARIRIAQAGRPQTNINMPGDKAVTSVDAKRYETTAGALDVLDTMAPFLERMSGAMEAGAQTGFGQQWALPIKQAAEEVFGVQIPGTSEQEVFKAVQNYLGPKMRTPGSGASSDRDVALFLDSIPSLGKSEQGNRLLMDSYNRIRDRYTQVAQIQQDLLREFDYIPVKEERARLAALGPIFSPEERKAIEAAKTTAPKPSAAPKPGGRNYIGFTPDGRRVYEENGERYAE